MMNWMDFSLLCVFWTSLLVEWASARMACSNGSFYLHGKGCKSCSTVCGGPNDESRCKYRCPDVYPNFYASNVPEKYDEEEPVLGEKVNREVNVGPSDSNGGINLGMVVGVLLALVLVGGVLVGLFVAGWRRRQRNRGGDGTNQPDIELGVLRPLVNGNVSQENLERVPFRAVSGENLRFVDESSGSDSGSNLSIAGEHNPGVVADDRSSLDSEGRGETVMVHPIPRTADTTASNRTDEGSDREVERSDVLSEVEENTEVKQAGKGAGPEGAIGAEGRGTDQAEAGRLADEDQDPGSETEEEPGEKLIAKKNETQSGVKTKQAVMTGTKVICTERSTADETACDDVDESEPSSVNGYTSLEANASTDSHISSLNSRILSMDDMSVTSSHSCIRCWSTESLSHPPETVSEEHPGETAALCTNCSQGTNSAFLRNFVHGARNTDRVLPQEATARDADSRSQGAARNDNSANQNTQTSADLNVDCDAEPKGPKEEINRKKNSDREIETSSSSCVSEPPSHTESSPPTTSRDYPGARPKTYRVPTQARDSTKPRKKRGRSRQERRPSSVLSETAGLHRVPLQRDITGSMRRNRFFVRDERFAKSERGTETESLGSATDDECARTGSGQTKGTNSRASKPNDHGRGSDIEMTTTFSESSEEETMREKESDRTVSGTIGDQTSKPPDPESPSPNMTSTSGVPATEDPTERSFLGERPSLGRYGIEMLNDLHGSESSQEESVVLPDGVSRVHHLDVNKMFEEKPPPRREPPPGPS